jgi:hypothetical protein
MAINYTPPQMNASHKTEEEILQKLQDPAMNALPPWTVDSTTSTSTITRGMITPNIFPNNGWTSAQQAAAHTTKAPSPPPKAFIGADARGCTWLPRDSSIDHVILNISARRGVDTRAANIFAHTMEHGYAVFCRDAGPGGAPVHTWAPECKVRRVIHQGSTYSKFLCCVAFWSDSDQQWYVDTNSVCRAREKSDVILRVIDALVGTVRWVEDDEFDSVLAYAGLRDAVLGGHKDMREIVRLTQLATKLGLKF